MFFLSDKTNFLIKNIVLLHIESVKKLTAADIMNSDLFGSDTDQDTNSLDASYHSPCSRLL